MDPILQREDCAMILALALALAAAPASASTASCPNAAADLQRAAVAWRAFLNSDFERATAEAEARRRTALAALAQADAAARKCRRPDRTAVARAALHYEIALVEARRLGGSSASLYLLSADLHKLKDLGDDRAEPDRFADDVRRFAELQAETHGRLVVPAPAVPSGPPASGLRLPPSGSGGACTIADSPPLPRGAINPVALDAQRLRAPHGSTGVVVTVAADGSVLGTLITASSGDGILDQAVSNAARLTTYVPARVNCQPVIGEYRFTYTFPQL